MYVCMCVCVCVDYNKKTNTLTVQAVGHSVSSWRVRIPRFALLKVLGQRENNSPFFNTCDSERASRPI